MKVKWIVILVLGVALFAFGCTKKPASEPIPEEGLPGFETAPPVPEAPGIPPSPGLEPPAPSPEGKTPAVKSFEGKETAPEGEPVEKETEEDEGFGEDPS